MMSRGVEDSNPAGPPAQSVEERIVANSLRLYERARDTYLGDNAMPSKEWFNYYLDIANTPPAMRNEEWVKKHRYLVNIH